MYKNLIKREIKEYRNHEGRANKLVLFAFTNKLSTFKKSLEVDIDEEDITELIIFLAMQVSI